MKRLIILAGYPATGKTYIVNKLLEYNKDLKYISIDEIKEDLYNEFGFVNTQEKNQIYNLSFELFYMKLNSMMRSNYDVVIDYPFSYLQYPTLKELSVEYDYLCLTVRLNGDINEIYKRRVSRDLSTSRHPAHLLDKYEKGKIVSCNERKNKIISLEEFKRHCELREYDKFKLGKLLELDVTNNYADIDEVIKFTGLEMST